MSLILDYLFSNFITLMSIVGLLIILVVFPLKSKKLQVTMIVTLAFVFLMTFATYGDIYISDNYATFTYWRVIYSYLSYTLKVATFGSMLLLFVNARKIDYIIIIGITLANDLVYSLMFFTHLVVWFDETNCFCPGPLRLAFIVPGIIYFLMLFVEVYRKRSIGRIKESAFTLSATLLILTAVIVEFISDTAVAYVPMAVILGCIFFFIEIYASEGQNDPVTGLMNRQYYTMDLTSKWKRIECVISSDMNNLKEINDEKGHEAGDRALYAIGQCMKRCCSTLVTKTGRAFIPYRIGGDEMSILIYRKWNRTFTPAEAENLIRMIQEEVRANGYELAAGYAMNDKTKLVNEILDEADKNMYANKKALKAKAQEQAATVTN